MQSSFDSLAVQPPDRIPLPPLDPRLQRRFQLLVLEHLGAALPAASGPRRLLGCAAASAQGRLPLLRQRPHLLAPARRSLAPPRRLRVARLPLPLRAGCPRLVLRQLPPPRAQDRPDPLQPGQ